jgi:biopolymer transport protein ExbB
MSLSQLFAANGVAFSLIFLALSLTSVTLVVWRIIKNFRAGSNLDQFLQRVENELQTRGGQAVYELCRREAAASEQVIPKVFAVALEEGPRGRIAARDAVADCIETEIMPSLQSLLPIILLLAKVAPMVGLLGTVAGMIGAFQTIAGATKVDPSALANDIGMALFTTAEGLIIAIPLIFAYTLFRERVKRFEVELQRGSQEALKLLPKVFTSPSA